MKNSKTVAITGASGFLGTELTNHLVARGYKVVALVRSPSKFTTPDSVEYRSYDLEQQPSADILQGVDYLVHAAFIKYDAQHPDAYELNLQAATQLLQISRTYKLRKNVFISSMSAHEHALSVYGKQKLRVEQVFNGTNDISLRCGLILGQGGIVKEMSDFMRTKHVVPLIDGGKQPLQVVSVADLCTAIEAAFTGSATGTLTIANPTVYTYREFYRQLAAALSVKVFFLPVSFTLLMAIFKLAARLHVPLGVGEDNLLGLKALSAVKNETDLKILGVKLDDLETTLSKINAAQTN